MTATTTLFPAIGTRATSVVTVTPGLNNKPEAMQPLIDFLIRHGYDCVLTSFAFGQHREPLEIANLWIAGVAEAHALAEQRCGKDHACSVAYSLGAVATLAFLQRTPSASLDRMFLVAPPLSLTAPASLIRALTPLRRFGLGLPSLAPKSTRANTSTAFADYQAMLSMIDDLKRAEIGANVRRIDTRVLLAERDELVDAAGVREWVVRQRLNWPVSVINSTPPRSMPHHLMLSETTMGRAGWQFLTTELLAHLSAPQRDRLTARH